MARSVASKKLMVKKGQYIIKITLVISLFISSGCGREELNADYLIYNNDFENSDLTHLTGAKIFRFDENNILGNYNNEGFRLALNKIPEHDYIHISFDLYLHDSWDGNTNGVTPDFPDLWIMELDRDLNLKRADSHRFETTFSNGPCDSELCLYQSYPNNYPFLADPKTGTSFFTWGTCHYQSSQSGTMVINIQKTYPHSSNALTIDFYDRLYQPNVPNAKCDESWSLDNLQIRALTVK